MSIMPSDSSLTASAFSQLAGFPILMAVAILILCLVPGIAMWLPDLLLTTTR